MKRSRARLARAVVMVCAGLYGGSLARGQLVNRDWNAGTGNWNVAGNWTPATSAPQNGTPVGVTYTVQIGNLLAAAGAQATFVPVSGSSGTINTLTLSNNADLFTNGNQLNVLGQTTVDGAGSTIRVDPHASPGVPAFQTLDLDLNNGGGLSMAGGVATVSSLLEINASSVLGGHGTINVGDSDLVVKQAFENSGLLQPQSNNIAPQTLTIHANGVDTIDLDGDSETGVVDVDNALANANADTVTLVIDGPLADPFGGLAGAAIQIGQRDTLTFTKDFSIAGPAAISLNGGTQTATMNGAGNITSISGASFTITGAAVIANDATFTGTANVITVNANSSLELAGAVLISDASALSLTSTSALIISGNTTVNEAAGDFNWDGTLAATTIVKGTGVLSLTVNHIDEGNDIFNGTLNLLDNGDVTVNNTANAWTMAGTLDKQNPGTSTVGGASVNVTGSVQVGAGTLSMPVTTLSPGANVTVDGTLILGGASVFAGPASIAGTGFLRMAGTSTVSASTTIGVATFDWDGLGTGTQHTINAGAIFTINSPTLDTDGDMDDPFSLAGPGAQVIVNGPSQWTSTATITANVAAAVGSVVIGGTSRLNMAGTLNVDGPTTISAPITFASGSTTAIDAGVTLSLTGGNNIGNSNLISGGVISGPGTLAVSAGRVLSGFGTISSPVAFSGDAVLEAAGGLLTLSGTIVNGGLMRVGAGTSALNLTNAFNTSSTLIGIQLNGGTLQGATLTTSADKSIRGSGTISNVVINTGTIQADGGTLVVNNTSNDWDGPANTGILRAQSSGVLDLRDNATFPFGGSVVATSSGRVFTNGFGMNFSPGSSISLTSSTFESTSTTNIGGTLTTGIGAASTIKVGNNFFLTFEPTSNTTLGADLRLENNNINIDAGATFSGSGALVIPNGSHLVMDNNANASVLLDMQGAFRPGNFEGIGRVDLKDYQQRSAPADPNAHLTDKGGQLFVEVRGTALNQYDRLVVNGTAQVDGYLNIDIDEISPGVPFVPAIGDMFNIITATGLVGKFDDVDISGMPVGETFYVNYLGNAVQLIVVARPSFAADFDDDGDVDFTDLAIWKAAYRLNQLGDATGDNITDNRDWTIWRDQLGSKPGPPSFSLIPEPGAGGLLAMLCGLGTLRRRVRRVIAPLCITLMMLLPAISHAKPTMTVVSPGAGTFVVQVAPDPALFNGASGSLAIELAFDILGADLSSATINTGSFPFSLPGNNPFTGNTTEGVQLNLATDKLFISLGSNSFTTGAMVNVATINTGAGPTAVSWGGHFITSFTPNYTGSRITQNGVFYDGFQGLVNSPGTLLGDFEPDGDLDASDIDALLHATQGSIPPGQAKFDLNHNNLVNSSPNSANSDADIWVRFLKDTEYGDANLDRKVDIKDLYLLATNWRTPGGWAAGDFDGSGFIDAVDLGVLASKWQFGVSPGGGAGFAQALESVGLPAMTTVPEPSLAGVIGVTLLLSFRRGNARRGPR